MTLTQFFKQLYPKALALSVDHIEVGAGLVVHLSSRRKRGICPYCSQGSERLHSRYERTIRDLPCVTFSVSTKLSVRRFRCVNQACSKHTFAERFEGLVLPYARYTSRLNQWFREVGLKVGAEPGAKLLETLIRVSPDKLLSCVHKLSLSAKECPKRIGIDDFALRKGTSYGTIIVDLAQGEPIELLPSREVDEVVNWLSQHPHIERVARDRSKEYALAVTKGAPQAVQVMDRWHVLKNLREAIEKDIGRRYADIKKVFEEKGLLGRPIPRSKREREAQVIVLKKQQNHYRQVHALHQQGETIVQIG